MLRKLAGQTIIYGVSSIAARLLNYLLTPYLTRIMTPPEYGVITDIYALIPFVMILLTMGMETGYFKFAGAAKDADEKKKTYATTWGAVTYVSLAFMAIVLLLNNDIASMMGYSTTPSYIWIVALIIAIDAITAIPFARLREQGRAATFVMLRVLSVVINVGLCLFFYSVMPHMGGAIGGLYDPTYGAGYVFVANLIASLVTLVVLLFMNGRAIPRIDGKMFRKIAIYSLPLLISGVAGTANEFIDRQMIKYLMPEDVAMTALGIYGAVVKIGVIMLLFTQMYRLAAEPFFLSGFKKDDFKQTNAEALKYFIIVSVFIFMMITLFVDVFALIVGVDFREGMYILPVVLIANVLAGVVLNLSFWYKQAGKTIIAIIITGIGLVFTVALNVALIPVLGYYGAAIARLGCEVAMVAVSFYLNRRFFPTPYNLRRIGFYVLVGAVLYGIGLLVIDMPDYLRYTIDTILLVAFVLITVRVEKIDVIGLIKGVIKR